jgi:putative ABC transport system permease protein
MTIPAGHIVSSERFAGLREAFPPPQSRWSRGWSSVAGGLGRHWQNVVTAFVQVWANKGRSLLTTLGIIIGVMSTITVVSLVQGFGNYMTDIIRGFGTNLIFVFPYSPTGFQDVLLGRVTLDVDDIRAVGTRCDKVRRITPILFTSGTVEYGRSKVQAGRIRGATEEFQSIRSFYTNKGRFFSPLEVDRAAYVCVLGSDILRQLECDDRIVGDDVFIAGQRFRVLGVLETKGKVLDDNPDEVVVVPYTTALKVWPEIRRFMPFMVEATGEKDAEECGLQITKVLRERHHLQPGTPNDFQVHRQDELLRDLGKVQTIATSVLAGIVGISLIVGGIGVMNVMLVSVTERTREIGLRKSVGGRRRDIMAQFLTEAVVLAVVGGAIGVLLGYSICYVASLHPAMVQVVVPMWAVLLGLSFSAGVGVLFGIIPAFKAAILHPIDALRHE